MLDGEWKIAEIAAFPWRKIKLIRPDSLESEQQRAIFDSLPVLVFLERAGILVYANAEVRQMLGDVEDIWEERPVEDVLWGLFSGMAVPRTLLTERTPSRTFHATLPVKSGRLVGVEGIYSVLNAELNEAVIVAFPSERNLTPRARLMEDVLACLPEAMAIVHQNHVIFTNPAFSALFGYASDEVSGKDLRRFMVPDTRQHEIPMLERAIEHSGNASLETVRLTKTGALVDVAMVVAPLVLSGENAGFVVTYRDIGESKQVEAKLQHDAMHDLLTGLPNRALFLDRLTHAFTRRARRSDQSCGVLFVDLDHFKEINDSMGHAAGDAFLVTVAERLTSAIRPQDTAARLGGDEFAILVENIASVSDLEVVASRALTGLKRPIEVFGHPVESGASIGAAMAGPDHMAPESLIRDADFAMYRAKQDGGNRIEIFDKNLKTQVTSQQQRERELRQALDKREYEIWYQPIYRLQSGKLEAFESQLRWRRPNGAVESFHELLTVAEETGLSISIGRETVETACRQLRSWTVALPESDLTLTVNLSQRQFFHPDMIVQLKRALAVSGVDPTRMMFEVSETTLVENQDAAVAILQRMVDCNVRVAIDNFGSALAPLNQLVRLPINVVKLDSSLTAAATTRGRKSAVLESVIQIGRNLGVQVVAQGIESAEQLGALCHLGCELGQGPHLGGALEQSLARQLAALGRWALVSQC
jgi:Amt family ammonium transporter